MMLAGPAELIGRLVPKRLHHAVIVGRPIVEGKVDGRKCVGGHEAGGQEMRRMGVRRAEQSSGLLHNLDGGRSEKTDFGTASKR
jgi:hypothetical protein